MGHRPAPTGVALVASSGGQTHFLLSLAVGQHGFDRRRDRTRVVGRDEKAVLAVGDKFALGVRGGVRPSPVNSLTEVGHAVLHQIHCYFDVR